MQGGNSDQLQWYRHANTRWKFYVKLLIVATKVRTETSFIQTGVSASLNNAAFEPDRDV